MARSRIPFSNPHFNVDLESWVLVGYFWLQGMWDPSSLTKDQTLVPCSGSMESLTTGPPGDSLDLLNLQEMSQEYTMGERQPLQ